MVVYVDPTLDTPSYPSQRLSLVKNVESEALKLRGFRILGFISREPVALNPQTYKPSPLTDWGLPQQVRLPTGIFQMSSYIPYQDLIIIGWVLPPLSNSWIIIIIWLYIALNRTPNIDCYCVGAVPKIWGLGFRVLPYNLNPQPYTLNPES